MTAPQNDLVIFRGGYLRYPCLAQHFVNSLAIAAQTLRLRGTEWDEQTAIPVEATPTVGGYRSAIALTLKQPDPARVAAELAAITQVHLSQTFPIDGTFAADASGWITFQASLETQLAFLTQIAAVSPTLFQHDESLRKPAIAPELVFELQYAHARCCRLLRLAQLKEPSGHNITIPWLRAYHVTCNTAVELQLWTALLTFPAQLLSRKFLCPSFHQEDSVDSNIGQVSPKVTLQTSLTPLQNLGQSWVKLFQKFYSGCSLFGESPPESQDLLALRVFLWQGLKNILAFILQDLYCQSAPEVL